MTLAKNRRIVIASVLACASAIGTLFYARLAWLSENTFVAAIQTTACILLLPGLIGAIAVSGNIHAFSLWVAAPINALVYFGLGWIGYNLLNRFRQNRRERTNES